MKTEVFVREIEDTDALPCCRCEAMNAAESIARHYDRVKGNECRKAPAHAVDGERVGFVSSMRLPAAGCEGCDMRIIGIAVKKGAPQRGDWNKPMPEMERFAREKGVYDIGLNTGVKRTDAHAFDKRCGYTAKGHLNFGKMLKS